MKPQNLTCGRFWRKGKTGQITPNTAVFVASVHILGKAKHGRLKEFHLESHELNFGSPCGIQRPTVC